MRLLKDSLTLDEGSAPATPAANKSILYVLSDGLWYTKDDAGVVTPLGMTTQAALLNSSLHADTLTGTVVRGAMIAGNSTPKWSLLTIGAAGYVLRSDGTDLAWGPQKRANGTTSSSTPTPNVDTTELYFLSALATNPTFGAPTGTPYNGQALMTRIKDNGTARTLAWNAAYQPGGVALPTTTVISKILHTLFIYDADNSLNKWMCVGSVQEA